MNTETQFDCLMHAHQTLLKNYADLADRVDKQDQQIQNLIHKNTELNNYVMDNEVFACNMINKHTKKINNLTNVLNNTHKDLLQTIDEKTKYKKVLIGYRCHSCSGHIPVFANINQFKKLYSEVQIFILESLLELNIKVLNLLPNMRFLNDNDNGFSILKRPSDDGFIPQTLKRVFDFCNKHNIRVLYCGSDKWEGKYISEYSL